MFMENLQDIKKTRPTFYCWNAVLYEQAEPSTGLHVEAL
jgi:hypothetical protein